MVNVCLSCLLQFSAYDVILGDSDAAVKQVWSESTLMMRILTKQMAVSSFPYHLAFSSFNSMVSFVTALGRRHGCGHISSHQHEDLIACGW